MISINSARIVAQILNTDPDPVPKYRLLTDVLPLAEDDPELMSAREAVLASRWVREIVRYQHDDGSWGNFHSLSAPAGKQPTTEQALRRLLALGLTVADAPVTAATGYMERVLAGEILTPDRVEKTHRWDVYMPLMLAAWLRDLSPRYMPALAVAHQWARIIGHAFSGAGYDQGRYLEAYREEFRDTPHPRAGRLQDFVHFYTLRLLPGMLPPDTEDKMLAYVLDHPTGIYYVYNGPVSAPPTFQSREAGRYLAALELLAAYPSAHPKLSFAIDWLTDNLGADGLWDLGTLCKDGVHFPLSASWRAPRDRRIDCSVRILALLARLHSG